jgi:succinate dehydrogenase / fumarate reductase cytochrome b subunit
MWFADFYRNAVVKKAVMAVTGVVLFGWIVAHMAGNLKVFQGAEKFNHYAEFLREIGTPLFPQSSILWITRVVILVSVGLHIWSATSLTLQNRRARPLGYETLRGVQLDYAARTMRWSGYLIAVYVVYHLMHLTFGNAHPDFVPTDPYRNIVTGFQVAPVALAYIAANFLLGLHLYHGLWSMFQSVGLSHPTYNPWRRYFAVAFSIVVSLGFASVPFAVLTGVIS